MVPPPTWMAYSMASTASRESPWRWATSVMAFSASGVTVAFIIVNLSSSVPVRDYASHAAVLGDLALPVFVPAPGRTWGALAVTGWRRPLRHPSHPRAWGWRAVQSELGDGNLVKQTNST